MGFNTTVVVLNDALDSIANDENFGCRLADAIRERGCREGEPTAIHAGGFANAAVVIETHHSSEQVQVCVGHNLGTIVEEPHDRDAIVNTTLASLRETLRLALNEAKAYRENVDAIKARCNALLEEAREARARERAARALVDAAIDAGLIQEET